MQTSIAFIIYLFFSCFFFLLHSLISIILNATKAKCVEYGAFAITRTEDETTNNCIEDIMRLAFAQNTHVEEMVEHTKMKRTIGKRLAMAMSRQHIIFDEAFTYFDAMPNARPRKCKYVCTIVMGGINRRTHAHASFKLNTSMRKEIGR